MPAEAKAGEGSNHQRYGPQIRRSGLYTFKSMRPAPKAILPCPHQAPAPLCQWPLCRRWLTAFFVSCRYSVVHREMSFRTPVSRPSLPGRQTLPTPVADRPPTTGPLCFAQTTGETGEGASRRARYILCFSWQEMTALMANYNKRLTFANCRKCGSGVHGSGGAPLKEAERRGRSEEGVGSLGAAGATA